jgi:DNA repair protein RecO (recombination protein O)
VQSRILKTDALALRVSPFSRTSHVVRWLTASHGTIATLVKGACRPKSRFLGQYDTACTSELLFYERAGNGLHIAKECCLLEPRLALHSDWRAAACASYLCDFAARVIPEGDARSDVYAVLTSCLDALCLGPVRPPFLFWAELRLLHVLGFDPRLTACVVCGRPVSGRTRTSFSAARGGICCPSCARRDGRASLSLTPAAVLMLRKWQAAATVRPLQTTRCTPGQFAELNAALGRFIEYHLDIRFSSRYITMEMLGVPIASHARDTS